MPSFKVPPDTDATIAMQCGHCARWTTGPTTATESHGDVCATCAEDLPRCAGCDAIDGDDLIEDIYGDDHCHGCTLGRYGWNACADCERPGHSWDLRGSDNGYVCDGCRSNRYWECESCEFLLSSGSHCEDCDDDAGDSDYIHGYYYAPSPEFHGDGPTYLGFELEINTPSGGLDSVARIAMETLGPLGYLKEDSTIDRGFEIVTHPMAHAWASKHFPWELLDELRRMECCAEQYDGGLGLHVHVSRAGFDGPAHVLRWLQLFYDNTDKIDGIARRRNDEWAAWRRFDRRNAKEHAKGESGGCRYVAINTCNSQTFEVRVFASTLDKTELRAALDLVAASVEATRETTAPADVDADDDTAWDAFAESDAYRLSWAAFAEYVAAHDAYAALHSMITEGI